MGDERSIYYKVYKGDQRTIQSPSNRFTILGSGMSANVATQEGDHGCYHYPLIYAIKPNFRKYLSNTNEFSSNSTSYCRYFVSEIRKQTVSH